MLKFQGQGWAHFPRGKGIAGAEEEETVGQGALEGCAHGLVHVRDYELPLVSATPFFFLSNNIQL